jgi:hypothetical protein
MPDRARFGVLVATDGTRPAQAAFAASVEFPWPKRASGHGVLARARLPRRGWPQSVTRVLEQSELRAAFAARRRLRRCQTCHRYPEQEILARAEAIQDRTERLMSLAENALLALMDAVQAATARGVRPEALGDARAFHRKAQWRLDFVAAENSKGFHAPQEAARILGEAIDFARQGQAAALTAGR